MDDGHLAGEAGEVDGLLHGAVAAADHIHVQVAEEHAVAGGAEGNAAAGELLLVFAADGLGMRAGGDDDRLAAVGAGLSGEHLLSAGEINVSDFVIGALHAELVGLLAHALGQGEAAFALQHLAGVVLNVVGQGDLAAGHGLFDQQGFEAGAAGVQRGGKAGGACAKDNHVIQHGGSSHSSLFSGQPSWVRDP